MYGGACIIHMLLRSFGLACIDANPPLLVSELYTFGNVMDYLSTFPDAGRVTLVRNSFDVLAYEFLLIRARTQCYETSLGMDFLHSQRIVHGELKPVKFLP